jgi:hypothetical protein
MMRNRHADEEAVVPQREKPLTIPQYDQFATELENMAGAIRARPEMNHHFAARLAILAAQMREDILEQHPGIEGTNCAVTPKL